MAKGVLEAGMGHVRVDGDTPFEKFADVLTMRGGGLGPGSDQEISQITHQNLLINSGHCCVIDSELMWC